MLWKKIRIPSTCPHNFVNTKPKALFIEFVLVVDISHQKCSTISFIYACIVALRLRYTIEEHSLVVLTSGILPPFLAKACYVSVDMAIIGKKKSPLERKCLVFMKITCSGTLIISKGLQLCTLNHILAQNEI